MAIITSAFLAVLTVVIFPMARKLRQFDRGWADFMRDWRGEDPEPGRDAAPGVMERLNNIDGQFKKNSGSTLKDAIGRIEAKLNEVDTRLKKGDERMSRIEAQLKDRNAK